MQVDVSVRWQMIGLFFSHPRYEGWPRHGYTFSIYLCHADWLFHRESCPHIDAVHPRLRAPGIVPCIISFSRQLLCFLMVWPLYASFRALTVSNSSLFTSALLRTHSFVFFAVHETHRVYLSPFISKASRRVSSFFLSDPPYVAIDWMW